MPDRIALCYHGVSPEWPERTSVSPESLETHLRFVLARGYRPVTFSELVTGSSRAAVAVTFDDANANVFERAYPILAELGVPATVFVPTHYASSGKPMAWHGLGHWVGTRHEPELRCMSWQQLDELAAHGWEVGSHTVSHPRLPTLDDARLLRELLDSRVACEERLGRPCPAVAYPYSAYDRRTIEAARQAGYTTGASVPLQPVRPRELAWPRIGVFRRDGSARFRVKASKQVRFLTPVWRPALALARRIQSSRSSA